MTLGILGIVTLAELEANGIRRRERESAMASGDLTRIRNGWFALPEASREVTRTIRLGGRLTCGNALRLHGLWVVDDATLHVVVGGNAARLRDPDRRGHRWDALSSSDVRLHWASSSERNRSPCDDVGAALEQFVHCAPFESVVATLDSALNKSVASVSSLGAILDGSPRGARIFRALDGSSQSGTESLARIRLRRIGLEVRTQVRIEHVGRVDLLIGERIVLEIDSRAHHLGDQYESDRARDLELVRRGFIVIRASYRTVMHDWNTLESVIRELVGRGEHRRRSLHRREGLAIAID